MESIEGVCCRCDTGEMKSSSTGEYHEIGKVENEVDSELVKRRRRWRRNWEGSGIGEYMSK